MERFVRIVSLVPSLTETLFALGLTSDEVVGRTAWCIHPKNIVDDVMVIGGTKTPNLGKIRNLNPDLIVMDKEENPLTVYQTLKKEGYTIFVSEVTSPDDVPQMLQELGKMCNKESVGIELAAKCRESLDSLAQRESTTRTVPLIWHEPLMAVSPSKYPGAILTAVGFNVVDTEPQGNGYPEISIREFIEHEIELILLTSEPHNFSTEEGISIAEKIMSAGGVSPEVIHIDGEDLTWFGSRTASALSKLADFRTHVFKTMSK